MKDLKELMVELDKNLAQIEVKGDNVLILANARGILKQVYDKLESEAQNG